MLIALRGKKEQTNMQTQGNGEVNVVWNPAKEPVVPFEHAVSLKGKNLGLKEE